MDCFDKYLGIPTMISKLKTHIFNFVKERIFMKLKRWKEKTYLERVERFW